MSITKNVCNASIKNFNALLCSKFSMLEKSYSSKPKHKPEPKVMIHSKEGYPL